MAIRLTAFVMGVVLTAALHAEPTPGPIADGTARAPAEGTATVSDPHSVAPPGVTGGYSALDVGAGGSATGDSFWASAEYLTWWVQGQRMPPLVTSSPPGTPPGQAGILGVPGTAVLFGGSRVDENPRSGVRLGAGMWLDDCHSWGVGLEFFCLCDPNTSFLAASGGDPILSRPFFNTRDQIPDAQIAAFPGIAAGAVAVDMDSRLCGAGAYCRKALCCTGCWTVDTLVGYRYLDLQERLQIVEHLEAGPVLPGAEFTLVDTFETRNQFHGADVGVSARLTEGRYFVNALAKVAIGCNVREVSMWGGTQATIPGAAPINAPDGLLTTGGPARSTDQVFAIVPELRLNVGCQLSQCTRIFVGYSVMGWTNVARPGDQIDLRVNPDQIAPALAPVPPRALPINDTTLWLHGFNIGVAVNF